MDQASCRSVHRLAKWSAAWCLLLTGACDGSHVGLHAPPRTAPLPERIASYEQLRAESRTELIAITESGQEVGRFEGNLKLANGANVSDPVDILPIVAEDSSAASAAREYRDLGGYVNPVDHVLVGGIVLGIASGCAIPFAGENYQKLLLLGSAVSIVSTIGLYFATNGVRRRYHEAGVRAFRDYGNGLQRRLGVCEVEKTLIDCDFLEPVPGKTPAPQ
jgi:hypothetical protein